MISHSLIVYITVYFTVAFIVCIYKLIDRLSIEYIENEDEITYTEDHDVTEIIFIFDAFVSGMTWIKYPFIYLYIFIKKFIS